MILRAAGYPAAFQIGIYRTVSMIRRRNRPAFSRGRVGMRCQWQMQQPNGLCSGRQGTILRRQAK